MRYGSGRAGPRVLDGGTSWGHKRGTTGDHKLGAQAGGTSGGPRGTTMRYGPGRAGPHVLARSIIENPVSHSLLGVSCKRPVIRGDKRHAKIEHARVSAGEP